LRCAVASGVVSALCTGLGAGLPAASAAQDDPPVPSRAQVDAARARAADVAESVGAIKAQLVLADQQLQAVSLRAEQAVETWNGARYELQQTRTDAVQAQRRVRMALSRLAHEREQVAGVTVSAFQSGNDLSRVGTLVTGGSPEQFLAEVSAFTSTSAALQAHYDAYNAARSVSAVLAQQADAAVDRRQAAAARAQQAKRAAATAMSDAQTMVGQVAAQKDRLVAELADAQGISVALAHQRQTALAEAARERAEARAAAQARAVARAEARAAAQEQARAAAQAAAEHAQARAQARAKALEAQQAADRAEARAAAQEQARAAAARAGQDALQATRAASAQERRDAAQDARAAAQRALARQDAAQAERDAAAQAQARRDGAAQAQARRDAAAQAQARRDAAAQAQARRDAAAAAAAAQARRGVAQARRETAQARREAAQAEREATQARREAHEAARAARRARRAQQASPAPSPAPAPAPSPSPAPAPFGSGGSARAISFARAQLGEPYVWGAAGPSAWDCSGLTSGAWSAAGVYLPHYSVAQYYATTPVSMSSIRAGDLLFWGTTSSPDSIHHVALYIGGGMMIHASRTGQPVQVSSMYYWIPPNFATRV
jgi:cell wall-associated NlpC family hydrolase